MKKVLFNGKIYVSRDNFAQAVCFEDEIIKKVGTNEEVLAFAGDCEKVDLGGKTVIPGLNDSHQHLTMIGEYMSQANIVGATSIDDVVARCKQFMAENPEVAKHGIIATGWNQDLFTSGEKRYLYRWDLDRISTEVPVVLSRICGHILAANTKAIEMAGIGPDSPQIVGGTFEFGDDGFPNGFFSEFACHPLTVLIPPLTPEQVEELTLKAMEYCVSHGLTTVQSNDIGQCSIGNEKTFELLHRLCDTGASLVRIHQQVCFRTPEEYQKFLDGERKNGVYSKPNWLDIGPLKLFKDGSLGARTATVRQEYLDDPGNFGVEAMSAELMDAMIKMAADNDMQVVTHAIGDKAISDMLDSYEKVMVNGKNPLRHSIVHYQCLDIPLIERTAKLDVLAQVQPVFLTTDLHAVPSRFSPEMNRWFLAHKTFHEKGVKMSFGSDSPVEDCNPFLSIYCAVTRKDVKGFPEGGFYPEECVDVPLAIDCFTEGSAYCEFKENIKGRIKEGMLADMLVLDTDIFTCDPMRIKDILPVETIVGGKTMYKA